MHYDYSCDITSTIFGIADKTVVLFPDFECTVAIDLDWVEGEPTASCTDVLIDGQSLRHGDELAKAIMLFVMERADEQLETAGALWDAVMAREDVSFSGAYGDPDAHWHVAAE